jgi:CHAT domain-containing protein
VRSNWRLPIFLICVLFIASQLALSDNDSTQSLQQADASFAKGDFKNALQNYQALLPNYIQKNDRQVIADLSYKIGKCNRKLAKFDDAKTSLEHGLKLHQELNDKHGIAADTTEIAINEERQEHYEVARSLSEKALSFSQEIGDKEDSARSLENLAVIAFRTAQYPKAIELFERATDVAKQTGNKEIQSTILTNKGQVYWALADYAHALDCYNRAEKLAQESGNQNMLGPIIGNRALVYWNQGNLERALEDTERSGVLFEQSGNQQHRATNYIDIAGLNEELGNYGKAQDAFQNALKLADQLNDKGAAAVAWNGLANLNYQFGNYDLARDCIQRSIKLTEQTGEKREIAHSFLHLGEIEDKEQNFVVALKDDEKALHIFQELGEKMGAANTLQVIGLTYARRHDFKADLEKQKEALAIYESIGNQAGIGKSNLFIGSAHLTLGNRIGADECLKKSIAILQEVGWQDFLWQALYEEALILRDTKKVSESISEMKQAVEIIERVRETVGLEEQKTAFLESKFQIYDDLVHLLIENHQQEQAFGYAEKSKARAFLDLLSEGKIDPQRNLTSEQYEKKRELIYQSTSLNQEIRSEYQNEKPDLAAIAAMKEKQNKLDEDYLNLMIEIRRSNPRYAELQNPEPVSVSDAESMCARDSAVLEYFIGKHSTLFVITADGLSTFPLPDEKILNQEVKSFREAIQKPEPVWEASEKAYSRYQSIGRTLYVQLMEPAALILKNKRRIILTADGSLNYLPFEALLTRKSQTGDFKNLPYLTSKFEIQYVPSISALAALKENLQDQNGGERKDFVAFADPETAQKPLNVMPAAVREWSSELTPLPYARTEVNRISKLFPTDDVRVFTGKEASESNVKHGSLSEFKIVHFASHGLIDEEKPQFSALILNSGDEQEDGFLTMREIFDLHLNADLVVLSACKTGLGREVRGEGINSLSRAFFAAGASSAVVSLWNVSDVSTSDFMWTFYKRLSESGMNKSAALNAARLELIASGKFSHPYYWAPFIFVGVK